MRGRSRQRLGLLYAALLLTTQVFAGASPPASSPAPPSTTLVVEPGKWPLSAAQQQCVQRSGAASDGYRRFETLSLVLGTSYLFDNVSAGEPSPEIQAVLELPAVQALGNLTINDVAEGYAAWMLQAAADCGLPQLLTEGDDQHGATQAWWASVLEADVLPTTLYSLTSEDLAPALDDPVSGRRLVWSLTDWGLSKENAGWVAAGLGAGSSFLVGWASGSAASVAGSMVGASVMSAACLASAPAVGVAVGAVLGIVVAAGAAYVVGETLNDGVEMFYDMFETDEQLETRFASGQPFGDLAGGLVGLKNIPGAVGTVKELVAKNNQILGQLDDLARLTQAGVPEGELNALKNSIRTNKGYSTRYERGAAQAVSSVLADQINNAASGAVPAAQRVVTALRKLAGAPPSVPSQDVIHCDSSDCLACAGHNGALCTGVPLSNTEGDSALGICFSANGIPSHCTSCQFDPCPTGYKCLSRRYYPACFPNDFQIPPPDADGVVHCSGIAECPGCYGPEQRLCTGSPLDITEPSGFGVCGGSGSLCMPCSVSGSPRCLDGYRCVEGNYYNVCVR